MAEEPIFPPDQEQKPAPIEEYDRLVSEIEAIVERLESGDLPLAEALLEYQRGIELIRLCNDLLDQAELRISELASGLRLSREGDAAYRADYRRFFTPLGEVEEAEAEDEGEPLHPL
jgi:exodeoxyribonuclease VII small subunit